MDSEAVVPVTQTLHFWPYKAIRTKDQLILKNQHSHLSVKNQSN